MTVLVLLVLVPWVVGLLLALLTMPRRARRSRGPPVPGEVARKALAKREFAAEHEVPPRTPETTAALSHTMMRKTHAGFETLASGGFCGPPGQWRLTWGVVFGRLLVNLRHATHCKAWLAAEASKRGRWPDCCHGEQVCWTCDPCTCGLYEVLDRAGITPQSILRSALAPHQVEILEQAGYLSREL